MDNDELLRCLALSGQGDRAAFQRLFDATAGTLLAVALRILRDRANAEDAVQDAFVQIWHKAGDYHAGRGTVLAWMIGIVRYRAIDQLRRERVRQATDLGDVADDFLIEEPGDDRALRECLDRLSDDQRLTIHLAFFEGLTHAQLATRLTTPLGTIKTRIRRALQRLRECLAP